MPFIIKAIKNKWHDHEKMWDILTEKLSFLKDNNRTARKIYDAAVRKQLLPKM